MAVDGRLDRSEGSGGLTPLTLATSLDMYLPVVGTHESEKCETDRCGGRGNIAGFPGGRPGPDAPDCCFVSLDSREI